MLKPLLIAVGLLTRLPVAGAGAGQKATLPDGAVAARELGRSLLYYPWVGALIGIVLWLGALLGQSAGLSEVVLAALLLVVLTAVSGGLHLEGLADSSDGWAASHRHGHGRDGRQRTLEVMRESHCGAFAILIVALVLLCKFAALAALVAGDASGADFGGDASLSGALIAAPMLARASVIALYATTRYVRPGGMGVQLAENLPRRAGWLMLAACGVVTTVVCGLGLGLALIVVAGLVGYAVRALMMRIIGGTTGDTTGAMIELVETAVLLAATVA